MDEEKGLLPEVLLRNATPENNILRNMQWWKKI